MDQWVEKFVRSWSTTEGELSISQVISWIETLNQETRVEIEKTSISGEGYWHYDEAAGAIRNRDDSFFCITGICLEEKDKIIKEQPIIIQDEIGYLGIIGQMKKGLLHFLMQAKIEPGNVNKIQISPTIQATKSNFTQKHGGKMPKYLNYFTQAKSHEIIVDQLQSEQSSRFWGKRNRNIIIIVDENTEIEASENHRFMTLGQIKQLMRADNLVNMDTRTVLSCIPYSLENLRENCMSNIRSCFRDESLFCSIFKETNREDFVKVYHYMNNSKMFEESIVKRIPLHELKTWHMDERGIECRYPYSFRVIYCDISIDKREVTKWQQPLFEAIGMATFGLFTKVQNGVRKFLVRALPEVGCFDRIELAPSVQLESNTAAERWNSVDRLFINKYKEKKNILCDVILSEEGGRFYHEQNYNQIIEIFDGTLDMPPEGYFWLDFATLNLMNQFNNCLNVQLRNLLSLLEV